MTQYIPNAECIRWNMNNEQTYFSWVDTYRTHILVLYDIYIMHMKKICKDIDVSLDKININLNDFSKMIYYSSSKSIQQFV